MKKVAMVQKVFFHFKVLLIHGSHCPIRNTLGRDALSGMLLLFLAMCTEEVNADEVFL